MTTAHGVAVYIDDNNGGAWRVCPVDDTGRVHKNAIATGSHLDTLTDWLCSHGLASLWMEFSRQFNALRAKAAEAKPQANWSGAAEKARKQKLRFTMNKAAQRAARETVFDDVLKGWKGPRRRR